MSQPLPSDASPSSEGAAANPATTMPSCPGRWNELMIAAQRGDDRAYGQLMAEISQWLSRYFRRRLPAAAAEDATQETLLAIHMHKAKYKADAPMEPWLKAVARFKWIDQLRGNMRAPDSLGDIDVPVSDHGPATRAAILLEFLLSTVKPSQAEVIRLVKLHGSTVEEAASISGQSPSLVKVNVHRGLRRLGQVISD